VSNYEIGLEPKLIFLSDEIGADGFTADAGSASKLAKSFVN